MRRLQNRGFFELTWTFFRFAMKSIFIVLCVIYVFAGTLIFLLSPDLGTMPAQQFLVSLASAVVFGLVFVSYVTLLLAVPVSMFCAFTAFAVTGVVRLYEGAFPEAAAMRWENMDEAEPGAIEVLTSKVEHAKGVCPVCASHLELEKEFVSCVRCESPHHPECWTYIGTCATFGCGSDRARASNQPAPPAAPEWTSWREKWRTRADSTKPN